MGSKQSKIEGIYLPDTPTLNKMKRMEKGEDQESKMVDCTESKMEFDLADPRSPNGCRTPLSVHHSKSAEVPAAQKATDTPLEHPLAAWRKRIFKGFSYNLSDPRSPTIQFTRTPLAFEENRERTFNLDDTFADLFVESNLPQKELISKVSVEELPAEKIDMEVESTEPKESGILNTTDVMSSPSIKSNDIDDSLSFLCNEETMPCTALLTPPQQSFDPRSPTCGLERTPIIFTDDNESIEDSMLENVLATLALSSKANSSISFDGYNGGDSPMTTNIIKPRNKLLERVSTAGKKQPRVRKYTRTQRQQIYQDDENTSQIMLTPNKKSLEVEPKRTPLSCVKNRTNIRAKSVEVTSKTVKTRPNKASFDDNLSYNYD